MKKRMVKTVSLFLATLLALSLFSCHREEAVPPDEEITPPAQNEEKPPKLPLDRDSVIALGNTGYTQQSVCNPPNSGTYRNFLQLGSEECIVPALEQDFVPQGMDIWEEENVAVISGYFSDGKPSMLFAVDLSSRKAVWCCHLKDAQGGNFKGHVGGVAVTEKNLFLSAGKNKLFRYPLTAVKEAKNGDLRPAETVSVPSNASFCNYTDGILWVGDFYMKDKYETASFAHMKTRSGEEHGAIVCGYRLENTAKEIKASAFVRGSYTVPDFIFSIKDKIQGFTYDGESDRIIMSESYGRKNSSRLYFYENPMTDEEKHTTLKISGQNVPVWFLDDDVPRKTLVSLPMMEGIGCSGNKVFCLFESGANTYRLDGGKHPTDAVWSIPLSQVSR